MPAFSIAMPDQFSVSASAFAAAAGTTNGLHTLLMAGADRLIGDTGNDRLYGDGSADSLDGGDQNDTLYGGDGNDALRGRDGVDVIFGEAGGDAIFTGEGNDIAQGGDDDDSIFGEGGDGADTLVSLSGGDTLRGGEGGDHYQVLFLDWMAVVETGSDALYAPDGFSIEETPEFEEIRYDPFAAAEAVAFVGNGNDNILEGSDEFQDRLIGLGGDDTLLGGFGVNDAVFDEFEGWRRGVARRQRQRHARRPGW